MLKLENQQYNSMNRRLFILQSGSAGLSLAPLIFSSCYGQAEAANIDILLEEFTIQQLRDGYEDGSYSIRDIVSSYLDRIDQIDVHGPALNSIIQVNPEALDIAEALDQELSKGKPRGPMHGIPVILKDNIDTHDQMDTTAGSRALIGSRPLQDSAVAAQLKAAGAVILAKANLSEWANFRGEMSSSGWSGHGGLTKNPYVLDRNTCGSSAGSGAAVAANLTVIAIGTETNGSIVCPSTTNGIVGIKPTVGLISRSGIIPISYSQDTAGPMARTVTDAAICLGALTAKDTADFKTQNQTAVRLADYTGALNAEGLQGKRLGYDTSTRGNHNGVDRLMDQALADLRKQGAEIIELERVMDGGVGRHSFNVMLYEYKQGLNDYFASLGSAAKIKSLEELIEFNKQDAVELEYFQQEYLEMALEKGGLDDPEYLEDLAKMHQGSREEGIDKVMAAHQLDAIIAPTGGPAWKTDLINGDNFSLGSSSPAAIAGYPNITVPMGYIKELPVGISIYGAAWTESKLIEIAYAYEQATLHRKPPKYLKG